MTSPVRDRRIHIRSHGVIWDGMGLPHGEPVCRMVWNFRNIKTMRPNIPLMKATLTGALGGLLFGFDTVVISGAIDALVRLYNLSPQNKGLTVAIGLVGTVIGALGAGTVGQKLGGRETLRITALLYVVSAVGCGLAWGWYSFMIF